jgi:hypothetical protein
MAYSKLKVLSEDQFGGPYELKAHENLFIGFVVLFPYLLFQFHL